MGDETVDPEHQSEGDNKEGLYFGRDLPADCEEARKPLHGPNQWPDAVVLPDFKPVVTAYFDAVRLTHGRLRDAGSHGACGRRLVGKLLALMSHPNAEDPAPPSCYVASCVYVPVQHQVSARAMSLLVPSASSCHALLLTSVLLMFPPHAGQ